jgi:hypothetical protein
MDGERPVKAVKPLFLAHDDPTRIVTHGDEWLNRLRRLKKHRFLPEMVLIPTDRPTTDDMRGEAYKEICADLENERFEVSQIGDLDRIADFARSGPALS